VLLVGLILDSDFWKGSNKNLPNFPKKISANYFRYRTKNNFLNIVKLSFLSCISILTRDIDSEFYRSVCLSDDYTVDLHVIKLFFIRMSVIGGRQFGNKQLMLWLQIQFDCNSTALRPFDDIRHGRRHCSLNK